MADAASRSRIADRTLASEGERRIAWVARHSPVLNRLARGRLSDGALRGRRVAVVVHLEAKTAYLATLLAEAGAEVVAAGSNPGSTQDAICAALVERGIEVHARHGAPPDEFTQDLLDVADTGPEIVIDDGAELTRRIVEHRPDLAVRLARSRRPAASRSRRSPRTTRAASTCSTTRTAPARPRSRRSCGSRT
jgi:adenosylhomocysteinase